MLPAHSAEAARPRIGRYEIVGKLATGGMGEVFLAKAVGAAGFQKLVVIKKILPHLVEQPQFVQGLVREAKLLVMLDHPNIVQVLDLGVEGTDYFMAMEFVQGYNAATIAHYCAQKRLLIPAHACAYIGFGVLDGLDYAHSLVGHDGQRHNIIHRDVSPQNVMISREGRVKLTDFGIAKVLNQAEAEVTQSLKGKFRYMAPEAVDGGRIDQRYDLFASGILLFELLCRRHLFGGRNDVDILNQVREAKVPAIERYHPNVPQALVDTVVKSLQRDPRARYQTSAQFVHELRKAIPVSEAEAGAELRAFIADLYERPDFPINKPKLPDFKAQDDLNVTRSIILRSTFSGGLPQITEPVSHRRGSGSAAIVALSLGLLLVSVVVAVLAYTLMKSPRQSNSNKPQVVVVKPGDRPVDRLDAAVGGAALLVETPDAGAVARRDAVDKRAKRATPPTNTAKRKRCRRRRAFTIRVGSRVFQRYKSRLKRCFGKVKVGTDTIRVRVISVIERDGRVSKASIEPADQQSTDLGKCLISVARRMHYPCHDKNQVVFRQPLTVNLR